jgi:hypothetical protein
MAAAAKHFSFAHLPPGPRTADYSVRVLDCLCSMLGVSGYKGLMLRVQGHPLLMKGFKLSEEDRTIASNVAEFLQSTLHGGRVRPWGSGTPGLPNAPSSAFGPHEWLIRGTVPQGPELVPGSSPWASFRGTTGPSGRGSS